MQTEHLQVHFKAVPSLDHMYDVNYCFGIALYSQMWNEDHSINIADLSSYNGLQTKR